MVKIITARIAEAIDNQGFTFHIAGTTPAKNAPTEINAVLIVVFDVIFVYFKLNICGPPNTASLFFI